MEVATACSREESSQVVRQRRYGQHHAVSVASEPCRQCTTAAGSLARSAGAWVEVLGGQAGWSEVSSDR